MSRSAFEFSVQTFQSKYNFPSASRRAYPRRDTTECINASCIEIGSARREKLVENRTTGDSNCEKHFSATDPIVTERAYILGGDISVRRAKYFHHVFADHARQYEEANVIRSANSPATSGFGFVSFRCMHCCLRGSSWHLLRVFIKISSRKEKERGLIYSVGGRGKENIER